MIVFKKVCRSYETFVLPQLLTLLISSLLGYDPKSYSTSLIYACMSHAAVLIIRSVSSSTLSFLSKYHFSLIICLAMFVKQITL